MAEQISFRPIRAQLKAILGSRDRDRLYGFLATQAFDMSSLRDDFHGPVIDTNKWTVGNGAGAGAASPAIDVGVVNGAIKMVTGTANDNTAASTLVSGRHYRGDQNAIIMARVAMSAVTTIKVEVGFKDNILTSAGNGAVVNVAATPTFTATDGVCWNFDTNNTTTWKGIAVANTTGATTVSTAITPLAATYETVGIALLDGVAFYFHFPADGGKEYVSAGQAAAVTKTVLLAPYVYCEARSATSRTLNVDVVWAYQARTSVA